LAHAAIDATAMTFGIQHRHVRSCHHGAPNRMAF
jgi:hypothetical protein